MSSQTTSKLVFKSHCNFTWLNVVVLKITSRYAVDALLGQVFAEQPMHPAHHYRIHLWDSQRPENALQSAALCGPSMPAVAHMWHMPGHIYSKLHRYADAAWQQEASARVDHAHMNRAAVDARSNPQLRAQQRMVDSQSAVLGTRRRRIGSGEEIWFRYRGTRNTTRWRNKAVSNTVERV